MQTLRDSINAMNCLRGAEHSVCVCVCVCWNKSILLPCEKWLNALKDLHIITIYSSQGEYILQSAKFKFIVRFCWRSQNNMGIRVLTTTNLLSTHILTLEILVRCENSSLCFQYDFNIQLECILNRDTIQWIKSFRRWTL